MSKATEPKGASGASSWDAIIAKQTADAVKWGGANAPAAKVAHDPKDPWAPIIEKQNSQRRM